MIKMMITSSKTKATALKNLDEAIATSKLQSIVAEPLIPCQTYASLASKTHFPFLNAELDHCNELNRHAN